MGFKSLVSVFYAKAVVSTIKKWSVKPKLTQQKEFKNLISSAKNTAFGKDFNFDKINTYGDFKKHVPLNDYEGLKPYVDRIRKGEKDILWPGKPTYFAKTSGTTSGAKYIPITKESMPNHIDSAKNTLLSYIEKSGNSAFVDGKMIFLQGSPEMDQDHGIYIGRLSGIVAHHIPNYLQKNRLPSLEINSIEDWETKVDAIVDETINEDMRLISGIPAWIQMYFEKLIEKSGKKNIAEIFPNFSLFVYGGVNYAPYKPIFDKLIGKEVDTVETYPASEGFIAFQDNYKLEGLLLVINQGIFYEFIPLQEIHNENPTRLPLWETEMGQSYAIVINNNAGLWGYVIGDVVKVVSIEPYRIKVVGRTTHFISAFGEHVIAEEVESSMQLVQELCNCKVKEFHVAPQVSPTDGIPYHEWFIEFDEPPANLDAFRIKLDYLMQEKNIYYKDLKEGNILRTLEVSILEKDGFLNFMKSRGKLGGQNKSPRLANDRSFADLIKPYIK